MSIYKKCAIVFGLILLVSTTPVFGQTNRVYVAESGSDANLCTISAPCRTIAHAVSVVNAGGEVTITENGEYERFTVNKSLIVGAAPGITAVIRTPASYGVIVAGTVTTDSVTFRNLNFKGPGSDATATGITNSSAATMFIDNCVLYGFSIGIRWAGVAGNLFIHETTVRNSDYGISIGGAAAPAPEVIVRATIDNCKIEKNGTGIFITSNASATIRNTISASNTSRGVHLYSSVANQLAEATIDNCQINSNHVGLLANGPSGASIARLTRTTINNSRNIGVSISYGHTVYSMQNNTITGNSIDVSGSLFPLILK